MIYLARRRSIKCCVTYEKELKEQQHLPNRQDSAEFSRLCGCDYSIQIDYVWISENSSMQFVLCFPQIKHKIECRVYFHNAIFIKRIMHVSSVRRGLADCMHWPTSPPWMHEENVRVHENELVAFSSIFWGSSQWSQGKTSTAQFKIYFRHHEYFLPALHCKCISFQFKNNTWISFVAHRPPQYGHTACCK